MFKKRQKKKEYHQNRVKISKSENKRNLKFSIKFNTRFAKSPELHSISKIKDEIPYLRLSKKVPYIITASDSILGSRKEQQDSYFVTKSTPLSPFKLTRSFAVVCDGMGGLEAGDRASLTAVSMMKLAVDKLPTKKVDIPHFYSQMLEYIDYEINHWEDLKTDRGSGTTFVSVIIENKRLYWASVGDSSIFLFRGNMLKKITSEHNYKTYLNRLVLNGKITKYQAEQDPQQNALVSYLGMGGVAYRDINPKPYYLRNGDILVLCTDGITGSLSEEELKEIIKENIDDMFQCCKKITNSVKEKNIETQDNATVVIVHYVE